VAICPMSTLSCNSGNSTKKHTLFLEYQKNNSITAEEEFLNQTESIIGHSSHTEYQNHTKII
jgi:hypothetical protein